MFKHILVTTDLSSASEAAFDAAAELARKTGARISVLLVDDLLAQLPRSVLSVSGGTAESVRRDVAKKLEPKLEALTKRKLAGIADVDFSIVQHDSPAKAICDEAAARGCDLIVISTHGRSGVARAVIGSVAERVVRNARCPVLSVRS